jgi:hypothetical protein
VFLRQLVAEKVPAVSAVSYVEVLGYLGRLWREPEE